MSGGFIFRLLISRVEDRGDFHGQRTVSVLTSGPSRLLHQEFETRSGATVDLSGYFQDRTSGADVTI